MLKQFHILNNDPILESPVISATQRKDSLHASSIVEEAEKHGAELITQANNQCEAIRTQAYWEGFQMGLHASLQIASEMFADFDQFKESVAKDALDMVNLSIDEWFVSPDVMYALLVQLVQKKMIDKRYTVTLRLSKQLQDYYPDWLQLFHSNNIKTEIEITKDNELFELFWGPHSWQINSTELKKVLENKTEYAFYPKDYRQQVEYIVDQIVSDWEQNYLPEQSQT